MAWDGDTYQRRFDDLALQGQDVHGEATFVMSLAPETVLDAGCGTGRVAIELARRGAAVVGVDHDPSMLATARRLGPHVTWVESDLAELALDRRFDVVVMAGERASVHPTRHPGGGRGRLRPPRQGGRGLGDGLPARAGL